MLLLLSLSLLTALSLRSDDSLVVAEATLDVNGEVTPQVKDFDAPHFEGEKANLLRKEHAPGLRSRSIPRLVERNPRVRARGRLKSMIEGHLSIVRWISTSLARL
jgi:hypothetical protein